VAEELPGERRALGGLRDVVGERGPREEERSLDRELQRVDRREGSRAVPTPTRSPRRERQSSEPAKVSLPTLSITTGTPLPEVISRTRFAKSSRR
jgi:hypothetical protein